MEQYREQNIHLNDVFAGQFKFTYTRNPHKELKVFLGQSDKIPPIEHNLILIVIEWLKMGYLNDFVE